MVCLEGATKNSNPCQQLFVDRDLIPTSIEPGLVDEPRRGRETVRIDPRL